MAAPPAAIAALAAAPAENVLSRANLEFEAGKRLYCEDQWTNAAAAFTKMCLVPGPTPVLMPQSVELDNTKPLPYEYKVRALMHQARQEQTEFAGTGKGADGVATGKLAYDTAWRAVQKFGNIRWESLAVLAEATCLIRQYGIVSYLLQQVVEQPTYDMASLSQKAAIESHAKRHAGRGSRSCRHSSHRPLEVVVDLPPPTPVSLDPARWNLRIETAFSPDLLLRVVDLARADDPNVAIRLSGVCRPWRSILVNQPGCWQKLSLGPGDHMMDKARAFLTRCGGGEEELKRGLKELRVSEGFESESVKELGELLAPHAPFIQSLQLDIRPVDARILYAHLYHGLESVRSLDIAHGATTSLDFGLLPPKQCMLKALAVSKIMHDNPRDRIDEVAELPSELTTWLDNPTSQLAELEVLRMTESYLISPISSLYSLFQYTPELREVYLDNLSWWNPPGAHYYHQVTAAHPGIIRLEHLERWSVDAGRAVSLPIGYNPFQTIFVPNLVHLEIVGIWAPTETCLSVGLAEALPSLRSLIIGRTSLPDHFIDVLRNTPSLEFLALYLCNLSAAFLERFSREANTAPHLLPNLVALSLAGNAQVRTRYLREFLKGRAAKLDIPPPDGAPAEEGVVPAEVAEAEDDSSADADAPEPPEVAQAEVASSYAEPPPPPVARLRWLNIDQCATVDIRYYPKFQEKVHFVSHWMGAPDDDRIRGRGKWDWEKVPEVVEGKGKGKEEGKRKKVKFAGQVREGDIALVEEQRSRSMSPTIYLVCWEVVLHLGITAIVANIDVIVVRLDRLPSSAYRPLYSSPPPASPRDDFSARTHLATRSAPTAPPLEMHFERTKDPLHPPEPPYLDKGTSLPLPTAPQDLLTSQFLPRGRARSTGDHQRIVKESRLAEGYD